VTNKTLHQDALVVDCHHDILLMNAHDHQTGIKNSFGSEWTEELRTGGVDVQVLPIFIEEQFIPEGALRRTLQLVDALHVEVEQNSEDLAICLTAEDADVAVASNKIALVLSLEGTEGVGGDLGVLRLLYKLGLRMVAFTWNRRTMFADGLAEDTSVSRLTPAGVEAIRLMEELGIILDVTHLSDSGVDHALEIATRPLVASHSNCRAVYDHPRNLTDEQLRAIAATGGVIGINVHPVLVHEDDFTIERVVDHIEHMVEVAGEDHVGLGPDFARDYFDKVNPQGVLSQSLADTDKLFAVVKDLAYVRDLPNLTQGMIDRGLTEGLIKKILGENFMRVFREVMGKPKPA
jgi:membrane dipeptidase